MLRVIRGDCDTAVGVFANLENNYLKLRAQLFSDDKKKIFNYEISGPKENVLNIGKKVGEKLLELAGKGI